MRRTSDGLECIDAMRADNSSRRTKQSRTRVEEVTQHCSVSSNGGMGSGLHMNM